MARDVELKECKKKSRNGFAEESAVGRWSRNTW